MKKALFQNKLVTAEELWLRPGQIRIEKVFIPKGDRMKSPEGNPYEISEAEFKRIVHLT